MDDCRYFVEYRYQLTHDGDEEVHAAVSKLHEVENHLGEHYSWCWWCPACESIHQCDDRWGFNGSETAPTFTGSVLIYPLEKIGRPRCHSQVTEGKISYYADSTHKMAGQTVDMPDWPDDAYRRTK